MADRLAAARAALTRAEQATLSGGAGPWTTAEVPRVGLGAVKMTDGSNGARGGRFHGTTATCFPSGTALAATWNVGLAEEIGACLAREVGDKAAHVLLAPTLNLHRYPLAGRNYECYGEDPYLAARMGLGYITGLQRNGVAAVAKHFTCNDSELQRERVDVRVGARALRELYLVPFEVAVRGGVWAVMAAYNRVNGVHCAESEHLLRAILKQEWGFDGPVISDWGGTNSSEPSLLAGLDLEMPGPPTYLGPVLLPAVEDGRVPPNVLDESTDRLFLLMRRTGAGSPELGVERSVDRREHREVARRAATESIVLLHNDGLLPLEPERLRSMAVLGPAAAETQIQGGGSSHVNPPHQTNILDGIRALVGDRVQVRHEPEGSIHRYAPLLTAGTLRTPEGHPGALVEYFRGDTVVRSETVNSAALTWIGAPLPEVPMGETGVRCTALLRPADTGTHVFGLTSAGRVNVLLDGQPVLDSGDAPSGAGPHFFGRGTAELRAPVSLTAGESYRVEMVLRPWVEKSATAGLRLGLLPPERADPIAPAARLAAECDVAVVAAGTSGEWEMEGGDRPDLELPGEQADLIRAVAAANPRTVVLVNSGSVVDTSWTGRVAATCLCWFAGQEQAAAVTDVLFGRADPGGRLPTSFPAGVADAVPVRYQPDPPVLDYAEDLNIGYRHFDAHGIEPRFCFGHGLSYTQFEYSQLAVPEAHVSGERSEVSVLITNAGSRPGSEVVQLYVGDSTAPLPRPPRELKGFAKVHLDAGQSTRVSFVLDDRSFAFWDDRQDRWRLPPGPCDVHVGASSRDLRLTARLPMAAPASA